MIGRIIEDLHGHKFKVKDWHIIPKDNFLPLIEKGEHLSLQADRITQQGFILSVYNDSYKLSMYSYSGFRFIADLELLEYKKENDIRTL